VGVTETLFKKRKKIIIILIISLISLLIVYLGMAVYFMEHFYFRTEINGTNVSGKSVKAVERLMLSDLEAYTLTLKMRDDKSEEITASDIGLRYNEYEDFKSIKKGQNPFAWITTLFNKDKIRIGVGVSYDVELLRTRVDRLSCFNINNIVEPENPTFIYEDNSFVIVDEVNGSKVNKEVLLVHVAQALNKRDGVLDLDEADCYIKPEYTSKSPEIIKTRNLLNKYVSTKITYVFGDRKEILEGSTINKWLSVNENYNVEIDEDEVKKYIDSLASKYNTVGRTRKFTTSSGRTINIGKGDYGWAINKAKETEALIEAIEEGKAVSKEPAYSQRANSRYSNDIGNTYVEIDMSRQHLWFYKNGKLIANGPIVTGNVSKNHTTPPGVFRLKAKIRNTVLRGRDYEAPVDYWMPFNGGIGMHDADWRSSFGGQIYRTNGSRGCINCPYNLAKTIYNNIEVGTPVICFY
jgi:hypothetical protein